MTLIDTLSQVLSVSLTEGLFVMPKRRHVVDKKYTTYSVK
jgi:hypothetical protein